MTKGRAAQVSKEEIVSITRNTARQIDFQNLIAKGILRQLPGGWYAILDWAKLPDYAKARIKTMGTSDGPENRPARAKFYPDSRRTKAAKMHEQITDQPVPGMPVVKIETRQILTEYVFKVMVDGVLSTVRGRVTQEPDYSAAPYTWEISYYWRDNNGRAHTPTITNTNDRETAESELKGYAAGFTGNGMSPNPYY